jgi:peptide/nickel transport system permease protein
MKKKKWSRNFAIFWIAALTLLSVFFYQNQKAIERHTLNRVLSFGYDAFGRNCFQLTLTGLVESMKSILPIGIICILVSLFTSGVMLKYHDRFSFMFRTFLDTLTSLPGFLIALSLSAFFSQNSGAFFIAAIIMVYPTLTRFFEGQVLKLKSEEFIKAAQSLGASSTYLFYRHYLPVLLRLLVSILPFIFTRLIIIETSLSFLGLGSAPKHETWGKLLYQGKDYFLEAPWIMATASIPLFLTLFSFHLLSESQQN